MVSALTREIGGDFRWLFESAPAMVLVLAPDFPRFTIVAATDTYLLATGTRRDEIVGRGIFEVFPDNAGGGRSSGKSALVASFRRAIETRAPDSIAVQRYDIVLPGPEPGGLQTRYWSILNAPVLDEVGEVRCLMNRVEDVTEYARLKERVAEQQAVTDYLLTRAGEMEARVVEAYRQISEQEHAREELRHREARLRALADSMPQLAWIAEPDGSITWYNQRWYEYTGTTPEVMEGWGWQAVHEPATLPDVLRRWKESIATGAAFEMEFPLRGADGSFRPFLTRGFPVKAPDGGVLQWLGTNTDVTELVEAREALREANRRKDEFLAVLSHELRNPLAPIQNGIYLLERAAPGSERARRAVDVVRRQTEHHSRLGDDLLDVTRVARGKIDIRQTRLDLRELVRQSCEDLRASFEQREVELSVHLPTDAAWVDADVTRISQVLGNLLQNAAKFTPAGGRVQVELTRRDGTLEVAVRDNGVGIDACDLARLFEPFAQADQGLARTHGGLGLGLALAKGLVELHGGSIRGHSEGKGTGSSFVVSLPAAAEVAPVLA